MVAKRMSDEAKRVTQKQMDANLDDDPSVFFPSALPSATRRKIRSQHSTRAHNAQVTKSLPYIMVKRDRS